MIFPTKEEARAQSKTSNVIAIANIILADTETPVSVWMKLFANDPYSFLLESADNCQDTGRYSFLGGNPFMTFSANGQNWKVDGTIKETGQGNPIKKLREIFAAYKPAITPGLPCFCGGAVGYFAYDSIRLWENIPDKNPKNNLADEIFFGFYRELIVFDNREHRVMLINNIMLKNASDFDTAYDDAVRAIGKMEDRLAVRCPDSHVHIRQKGTIQSNVSRAQYEAAVEKCKEYIKAGDIFQVVLSQRFSIEVDASPFDIYRVLRLVNPSPYLYFLNIGHASIIGSSPELLARIENRIVQTKPIAGTIKRGKTIQEDELLSKQLLADPKEIAEHVMLVDLGRNDIGRVSSIGSVAVENMMHIEKFSHVMHIVTDVSGKLKDGCDAFDALFSCFPAGTLSGAPKIRAMEIIDELEPTRRGIYGGALGYIDFSGNLDSCIVIRTIFMKNNTAYIQAGAGIVADSVPSKEFDETVAKAGALFSAIQEAQKLIGR